jgi:hypothetical protein
MRIREGHGFEELQQKQHESSTHGINNRISE